ncbi:MAG TPA: thiamine phosphate synthase [Candidatus Acidoferrales bacterium]|jgi:thiamine-phosphate pyrophosphorylase
MNRNFPPLYAILSADLLSSSSAEHAAEFAVMLANAGIGIIQYRNKHASARTLLEISRRISEALAGTSARFVVNDRVDIARFSGAGGVHVGQDDLPVDDARAISQQIIPPSDRVATAEKFWIGVSTHTLEQVRSAAATSADYIAVGPIFATTTKQNHEPIVGTEFIRQARQLTNKPLVAIGGITRTTAEEVFRAGADSIAVARDLICAENPAARAAEYLAIAKNFRK